MKSSKFDRKMYLWNNSINHLHLILKKANYQIWYNFENDQSVKAHNDVLMESVRKLTIGW